MHLNCQTQTLCFAGSLAGSLPFDPGTASDWELPMEARGHYCPGATTAATCRSTSDSFLNMWDCHVGGWYVTLHGALVHGADVACCALHRWQGGGSRRRRGRIRWEALSWITFLFLISRGFTGRDLMSCILHSLTPALPDCQLSS